LSDLAAKGKSKNVHHPKTWKIFALYCAKMSKLTFHVGITGGKIDGYRFKVFADDNDYCPGSDRGRRPDSGAALIYPGRGSFPRHPAIIINFAKIFCHFVYFCFFVIDVMLLTSDEIPSPMTVCWSH
jgi:hypothetical protein